MMDQGWLYTALVLGEAWYAATIVLLIGACFVAILRGDHPKKAGGRA